MMKVVVVVVVVAVCGGGVIGGDGMAVRVRVREYKCR